MQADLLNSEGIQLWKCYWRQLRIATKIWGKNMSDVLLLNQSLFSRLRLAFRWFDLLTTVFLLQ